MPDHERSYFRARAEDELEAARSAGHPDAARAHYLLAGYYLDLAHNPDAASNRFMHVEEEAACREATRTNIPASRSARPSISLKDMRTAA